AVAALDARPQLRDFAVDLDHAIGDALLERAARTEPGLGQDLVQALLEAGGGGLGLGALEGQLARGLVLGVAHSVSSSCSLSLSLSSAPSAVAMSPMGMVSPLSLAALLLSSSNDSCGSSSPKSLSSDSGGRSSRRFSPK